MSVTEEQKINRHYLLGVSLAFLVIFSLWGLWVAMVTKLTTDGGLFADHSSVYPNLNAVYCHTAMIGVCIASVALLRFGFGPVLSPINRTVFAALLLFLAICVWEALDCSVGLLAEASPASEIYSYSALLVLGITLTIWYEIATGYDVIGSHLLL